MSKNKMYVVFHESWEDNASVFFDKDQMQEWIKDQAIEDFEQAENLEIYVVDRTAIHRPQLKFEVNLDV